MLRWPAVALALAVTAALAVACGGGERGDDGEASAPGPNLSREAEAGGITVAGTWLTAQALDGVQADLTAYPLDEFVLLEIAFTTHSGDLNRTDLERAAALSQGGTEERPVAWVSTSDDSHHRAGVLVFPRDGGSGQAVLTLSLDGSEEIALVWESPPT